LIISFSLLFLIGFFIFCFFFAPHAQRRRQLCAAVVVSMPLPPPCYADALPILIVGHFSPLRAERAADDSLLMILF